MIKIVELSEQQCNVSNMLVIDVGNTCVDVIFYDGYSCENYKKFNSKSHKLISLIDEYLKIHHFRKEEVLISSVVPKITKKLKRFFKYKYHNIPYIINENIHAKIKTTCNETIGADLLADMQYLSHTFEKRLIIDLGSASKYILMNKDKLIGVAIAPGLINATNTLFSKTALLKKVNLKYQKKLFLNNTNDAISAGCLYTYALGIKGIIEKVKKESKQEVKVFLTGGCASLIYEYLKNDIDEYDIYFTLKGIIWIYLKNKQN